LKTAVDSGIYLFDPIEKNFTPLLHPSGERLNSFLIMNETIWAISITDDYQQILSAFQFDGDSFTSFLDLDAILPTDETHHVKSSVKMDNGDFWFGLWHTFGPLLYRANGETTLFNDRKTFPGTGSLNVLDVGNNRIWCTGGNEVTEYDGKIWRIVVEGTDYIYDIIKDRQGRVWLATVSGVYCYNPNRQHSWVRYTVQDGLPFNFSNILFEDSHGTIWVGTLKGVSSFNPDADRSPPEVWMSPGKNSDAVTSKGNAQFVFEGIDKWKQTQKERLSYSYRIDDGEWSTFQNETVAALKS
jgi:hypothetical protein